MSDSGMETVPVTIGYSLDGYTPPKDCGDERCRDFFMEFIYFCVIPTSVLLFLTFILALCFCCSKSHSKPKAEDPDDQMRYDTIRRASRAMRRMSYTRDTPIPDSGEARTMTLERNQRGRRGHRNRDSCYSLPGTLQRNRNRQSAYYSSQQSLPPPPAYRLPPQYPDDNVFIQNHNVPFDDDFSENLRRQLHLEMVTRNNNGFVSQ